MRTLLAGSLLVVLGATASDSVLALCGAPAGHGGGLNACGCHFNRKTGECHCHRPQACGCECQPITCPRKGS